MSTHHIAPFRFGTLLLVSLTAIIGVISGCASTQSGATATPTPRLVAIDPALASDTVYITTTIGTGVSNDGYLVALNAQSGKLRWSSHAAGSIGVPVVGQGTMYMAASDGKVYAFATDTGKQRWQFQRTTGVGTNTGFDGYPTLAGQTLYVDSDGGAVYALDPATGQLRWKFEPGDGLDGVPRVVNGVV
jgi:outer membrane protein assembly factor BamB